MTKTVNTTPSDIGTIEQKTPTITEWNLNHIKTHNPLKVQKILNSGLEVQSQQNYIEVVWLKILNQNLDKPTHPDIIIFKEGEKYDSTKPYAIDNWRWQWLYNLHWAILESEHRWLRLITDEDWLILEWLWEYKLNKLLWLENKEDYAGYFIINQQDILKDNQLGSISYWTKVDSRFAQKMFYYLSRTKSNYDYGITIGLDHKFTTVRCIQN